MKKIGKIIAVLMLLAMFAMGCSQYVCPAYANDDTQEQSNPERS
jgi:PBP1b-binding outer membrane lipoprotein LpoB